MKPVAADGAVDKRTDRPLAGIGFVLAAVCCFSVLDTTTKTVVSAVPLFMALWVRYLIQASLSTALLWPSRRSALWRTANPRLQTLRGGLLLATSIFAFISLMFMPVGEFTAIVMVTPLVITLIANRWMGEAVSPLRWALVWGGFIGALLIIQPGGAGFQWSWLLPLCCVACNTWFQLLTSRLARTDDPATTHFYTGWVGTMFTTFALPFAWASVPDAAVWWRMTLMGMAAALGHFCLSIAYTRAPAATLTPYFYGQIGTAMLLGWLVLHHVPDSLGLLGMVIITLCGGASAWLSAHETRSTHLAPTPRPPRSES